MDIMRAVSDELGMELKIEDMAFDSIIRQSQQARFGYLRDEGL